MVMWWPVVVVVAKSRLPGDVIAGPALSQTQEYFLSSNGFRVESVFQLLLQ